MSPYAAYRWKNAQVTPGTVAILHRVFPLPCPAVTRVPVGKPHRIGPLPLLQFTQLTYSLTTLGIDTNLQFVFSGIIILVAVMLDCLKYVQKK